MKITKNMKIAGATALTLFSLVASFTAAIAWFSPKNSSVTADGMIIKADNYTTSFVSVEVHKCIPDQCTSTTLAFSSDVAMSMSDGSTPNKSLIIDDFGDLNKSQPVLLLFNLVANATAGNVTITAKPNNDSTWLPDITPANVNNYPLSNAVYFRSNAFNKTGTGFQFSTINVSDLNQQSDFVKETTNPYTIEQSITVFNGLQYLAPGASSASSIAPVTHVAVVLDYYGPYVELIQAKATLSPYVVGGAVTNPDTSSSENVAGNNNRLGFACDWKMYIS